jgi:hypothetical protein
VLVAIAFGMRDGERFGLAAVLNLHRGALVFAEKDGIALLEFLCIFKMDTAFFPFSFCCKNWPKFSKSSRLDDIHAASRFMGGETPKAA